MIRTTPSRLNFSEFTGIGVTGRHRWDAFRTAVLAGTMAGGGPFLLVTLPGGIVTMLRGDILAGLLLALFPVIVTALLTLIGMTLVALPLTALLRRTGRERKAFYVLAGAATAVPLALLATAALTGTGAALSSFGLFFAYAGALAGAVTGTVWGDWRMTMQAETDPDRPTNPIHDLIY